MSQVLTVPTHFNDIGELSEGFLDRVEQDTLILYGPVPYEDGSDIDFVVLLADGSTALEGRGRVRAAVDGGAERVPETRYDVVVEALELEGRYEVIFESLVMARQAVSEPPPAMEEATAEPSDLAETEPEASDSPDSESPELEVSSEEVFSIAPDEVMSMPPEEMEPLGASESDSDGDDEQTNDEGVSGDEGPEENDDAELEMSTEETSAGSSSEWDDESSPELSIDAQATLEKYAHEGQAPAEGAFDEAVASDESFEEAFRGEVDEDGQPLVAAEPNVGGPVPKPSMAAPPEAPPAPAGINLVPPPDGLTRPSRGAADEELLASFDEVGEQENSGLFEYEEGIPIPSRPPLPDLDPARRVAAVEANEVEDVEESEPPEAHEDYEEIRLSELAESAESAEEG